MAAPTSAHALEGHEGGPCSHTGEAGQVLPQMHTALYTPLEELSGRPSPHSCREETEAPLSTVIQDRANPHLIFFEARYLSLLRSLVLMNLAGGTGQSTSGNPCVFSSPPSALLLQTHAAKYGLHKPEGT